MYCIKSVAVLDLVELENTNSLLSNVVIICASIVHEIVSSCVPFTSSLKVSKELFIVNFPSLEGSPKLNSNNVAVKYPYSNLKINVCARVALDVFTIQHGIYVPFSINQFK